MYKELVEGKDYHIVNDSSNGIFNKILVIHDGVEEIPDYQFNAHTNFKTVIFPESLKKIGHSAFFSTLLTQVIIPSNVESIGSFAFSHCSFLNTVVLPKSLKVINEWTFSECSITNLELSENLEVIGAYAFNRNTRDLSIVLPDTVKIVADYAFYYCPSVYVKLNEGLEILGFNALGGKLLDQKDIPSTVKIIGDISGAYNICPSTNAGYTLDGSTLTIHDGVLGVNSFDHFIHNNKVKKVVLPESLIYIGLRCFNDESLEEVNMPHNLMYIGEKAFGNCVKLKEFDMPDSLKYLGNDSFLIGTNPLVIPADCAYDYSSSIAVKDTKKITSEVRYSELLEKEKQELNDLGLSPDAIKNNSSKIHKVKKDKFGGNFIYETKNYLRNIMNDPFFDENKHLHIIENLIQTGGIDNDTFSDIVEIILDKNLLKTMLLFLSYGYEFQNNQLLTYCVSHDNYEMARILLLLGSDVNERADYDDLTALMFASLNGNVEMVELLLSYNAKIELMDITGNTALDHAVNANNQEVIDILSKNNKKDVVDVESDLASLQRLLK